MLNTVQPFFIFFFIFIYVAYKALRLGGEEVCVMNTIEGGSVLTLRGCHGRILASVSFQMSRFIKKESDGHNTYVLFCRSYKDQATGKPILGSVMSYYNYFNN